MKENIILIGFMGSGKSSVGKKLAQILEYQFLDTDQMIEKKNGMSISELFEKKGEREFREQETALIREMNSKVCHCTIATGGGLPLKAENVSILKEIGTIVFLDVNTKTVRNRLKGDGTRPLLQGEDADKKIRFLLNERYDYYKRASDFTIDVNDKEILQIAEEIKKCYLHTI